MLAKLILDSIPGSIRVIRKLSVEYMDDSVTFNQLRILRLVKDGMSQSQIAETLQISMAAVSKSIDGLSNKKMLVRRPGKDKRCHQLVITSLGLKNLNKLLGQVEIKLQEGIKQLSPSEREELSRGLHTLDKLMLIMKEV